MYTLLKPILVREELLKRRIQTFTPAEFECVFKTSPLKTKYFLEEESKRGLFLRLKKGLYTLKTDIPSEEEIANRLYKPSYISFEYALAYHNILPEMTYQVTSATTKPTRMFTVDEHRVFSYFTIKIEAYSGYTLVKRGDKSFLIAEPEKALADYLYFVSLGKKSLNDRLITSGLNKGKMLQYAKLFKRQKVIKLVEELI